MHGFFGPIAEVDGHLWLIPSRLTDKQRDEMPSFQSFTVIEWEGSFYELQGQRPRDGWWWVEKIEVPEAVAA